MGKTKFSVSTESPKTHDKKGLDELEFFDFGVGSCELDFIKNEPEKINLDPNNHTYLIKNEDGGIEFVCKRGGDLDNYELYEKLQGVISRMSESNLK